MSETDALIQRHERETAELAASLVAHAERQVRELLAHARAMEAQRDALKADLAANAAMLARQCDLAREAEAQRDELAQVLQAVDFAFGIGMTRELSAYREAWQPLRDSVASALSRLPRKPE